MTFPLGRSVGPKADRRSFRSARAEGALLLLTISISLLFGCRPDPTGCGINDPCPPSTLEILPNAPSDLEVGRTMQLDARVLDQAGRVATGVSVAWTSDRPEVASVDASGLVRGMSAGTSTIAARVESASGSVTIRVVQPPNQAPSATISAPADGSSFTEGESIGFQGTGSDPEDGTLTGDALVWTSSRDGQIGTGTSITSSDLSVGSHTITLTATDSEGATGEDAVELAIEEDVTDLIVSAFQTELGITVPAPIVEPTDFTPSGEPRAGWTSTAYLDELLYRVYLGADGSIDAVITGPLGLRPEGVHRVAVAVIDYGNTNIGDVVHTLLPMAQDSINRKQSDYAIDHGYGDPIVTFDNTNILIPSTELQESFSPGSPAPFIDELVQLLADGGVPRSEYDILMVLDLDADNPGGQYFAAGIGGGFWVYAPCSPFSCLDPFTTVYGVWAVIDALYLHEIAHLWGYEHMWAVEEVEGGYASNRCPQSITATCESLFGWVDADGDGIPEIRDPTPYGRP